ncbi:MAG: addiction module protein [Candidatus Latescibacteria bacterium]|nr:addiction module protein [Candidatus Latescibacterota bacterium]
MTSTNDQILTQALELPSVERAELVEQLLASFELPSRSTIDLLWAKEAEDRIDAYDRGEIKATPAKEVFAKINRQQQS